MSTLKYIVILIEAFFSEAMDLLSAMLKSARKWVPQVWTPRSLATGPRRWGGLRPGKAQILPGAPIRTSLGAPSFRRFLPKGWDRTSPHLTFIIKSAQARGPRGQVFVRGVEALLLAVAVCFSVGATDAGSRFNDLNHRLMCQCGCAQLLGECDHVGCPSREPELAELSAAIASGATDDQILSSFAAKYGATVLAAPTTHGFDLVAWIAPIAVFAAALLGTILLVRQWSIGKTQTAPLPADPEMDAMRAKVRRETGAENDGGF